MEEFSDDIAKAPFEQFGRTPIGHNTARSRGVDHYHDPFDDSTATHDMVAQVSQRAPHGRHIVDQNVTAPRPHWSVERRTGVQSFHRIGTGMEYLLALDNVGFGFAIREVCQRSRQDGWDRVFPRDLDSVRGCI